jgi:hypothetical protein
MDQRINSLIGHPLNQCLKHNSIETQITVTEGWMQETLRNEVAKCNILEEAHLLCD